MALSQLTSAGWKVDDVYGILPGSIVVASASSGYKRKDADFYCDGFNDQVQIQAALDQAAISGDRRIVEIVPGDYNLSPTGTYLSDTSHHCLYIGPQHSDILVRGGGKDTHLRLIDSPQPGVTKPSNMFFISNQIDGSALNVPKGVTFSNFRCDGNGSGYLFTPPNDGIGSLFRVVAGEDITWNRVWQHDAAVHGVLAVESCKNLASLLCEYYSNGYRAFHMNTQDASSDILVKGLRFLGNVVHDNGVSASQNADPRQKLSGVFAVLQNCFDAAISDNTIYNEFLGIVAIGGSSARPARRTVINGNTVDNCYQGISGGISDTSIQGNSVSNSRWIGIALASDASNVYRGINCKGNVISKAASIGIRLAVGANQTIEDIELDNTIVDTGGQADTVNTEGTTGVLVTLGSGSKIRGLKVKGSIVNTTRVTAAASNIAANGKAFAIAGQGTADQAIGTEVSFTSRFNTGGCAYLDSHTGTDIIGLRSIDDTESGGSPTSVIGITLGLASKLCSLNDVKILCVERFNGGQAIDSTQATNDRIFLKDVVTQRRSTAVGVFSGADVRLLGTNNRLMNVDISNGVSGSYGVTTQVAEFESSTGIQNFSGTFPPPAKSASLAWQFDSITGLFGMVAMTTAQATAIASPATRGMYYDTTLNKVRVWTGAAFETVTSA